MQESSLKEVNLPLEYRFSANSTFEFEQKFVTTISKAKYAHAFAFKKLASNSHIHTKISLIHKLWSTISHASFKNV